MSTAHLVYSSICDVRIRLLIGIARLTASRTIRGMVSRYSCRNTSSPVTLGLLKLRTLSGCQGSFTAGKPIRTYLNG